MQAGFEPPMVSVAIGLNRPHLADIRASGRFALSVLDPTSRGLMTPFLRRIQAPRDALRRPRARPDGEGIRRADRRARWLDCELRGEHPSGDHVVVFGEVVEASLLREGDPSTHVRKNGLGY
jgi:flavin reductase (DIM6/NTAB) family NADH-FMN oxidoreductase RutF